MKRRLLGILVAAAMIICAIPLTASAESAYVKVADVKVTATGPVTGDGISGSVYVQFYKNGEKVDTNDADKAEITLSNASITDYGIETDIASEVVLDGENSIEVSGSSGIYSDASLTIRGSGSLEVGIEGYPPGIFSSDEMIFTDQVNIDVNAYSGIFGNKIYFKDGANINVTGKGTTILGQTEVFFDLGTGGRVYAESAFDADLKEMLVAVGALSDDTISLLNNNQKITAIDNAGNEVVGGSELLFEGEECYYIGTEEGTAAKKVIVESSSAPTPTPTEVPVGVPTGDSNNTILFSLLAVLGLAGAGFVYKRREN